MIKAPGSPEEWITGHENQGLREAELTGYITVKRFLASRGVEVESCGNGLNTIIPRKSWTFEEASLIFRIFDNPKYRQELANYIAPEKQVEPKSELVKSVILIRDFKKERTAFSHTFEWYISEIIKWNFQAFDSEYSVCIKNASIHGKQDIGDYDVLAVLGNLTTLYIECKTGDFCKEDLIKILKRSHAIHNISSILFLGKFIKEGETDIYGEDRLKNVLRAIKNDQTTEYMNLFGVSAGREFNKFESRDIEDSELYQWGDLYIILDSIENINVKSKLQAALRLISASDPRNQRVYRLSDETYEKLGFRHDVIPI